MEELANVMKTFVLQLQLQQEQQGISPERLKQQFLQQQEILMQQSKLLETVLQKSAKWNSSTISFTPDTVDNSISQFPYNPEEGVTFASWKDEKKALLLWRKLSPVEFEKYCNYILPKKKPGT